MSQVIIDIGYRKILLANDALLPGLLRALKGAVEISYSDYGDGVTIYKLGDELEIKTETVTRKMKFVADGGTVVDLSAKAKKTKGRVIVPRPLREALGYQEQLRLGGGKRS